MINEHESSLGADSNVNEKEVGLRASDPAPEMEQEQKMLTLSGVSPFSLVLCEISRISIYVKDTCALYILFKGIRVVL